MSVRANNLVLDVEKNIDPNKFDISKYEDFLDVLCGHREYQKNAVRTTARFLLGQQYKDTEDLAKKTYDKNPIMKNFYGSFQNFSKKLEFPEKLACTIDLATATGKSWVIYGIAQIMFSEGAVDQVLVLTPSVTVRTELKNKFEKFVTDANIQAALADPSIKIKFIPRVIDSSSTIKNGDICIDNVHKTYSHVTSSFEDSLLNKGSRTLVLNDEAHHIMNPDAQSGSTEKQKMKEWKKFLVEQKFDFKYIVGFTGTPYMKDEYAADVIYRYSLMQGMEGDLAGNFVIKKIDYVKESNFQSWAHKLEEIYSNHQRTKNTWKKADKHITIFITQTIANAEKLGNDLETFLRKKEKITAEKADEKVLVVTSSAKHEKNRIILQDVDFQHNPVEWIVSVSMLTEGWDVKNVFQIVPHQERAFNSKLLIAQVLGRGLRVPPQYNSEQPAVIVYNHHKWGEALRETVEEVLDYEKRVKSYIVNKTQNYNFTLHNMAYDKIEINPKQPAKKKSAKKKPAKKKSAKKKPEMM